MEHSFHTSKETIYWGAGHYISQGITQLVSNHKQENAQCIEKADSCTVTGLHIPRDCFIPWIHLAKIFHMKHWEKTEIFKLIDHHEE